VLFGLEFVCIYAGLQYTAASRLVVFVYLAPFVVAAGMPFIARGERLNAAQTFGLVLAFAALAFAFSENLVGAPPAAQQRQWLGDALAVAAALLWGLTTLVIRATSLSSAPPERTLFWQLAVSAPLLGVASLLAHEPWPAAGWGAIGLSMLYQAGIVAAASYLAWFWLLRHYPATRISAFSFLTPLFGLLFGAAILAEPLTARLVLALAGVTAGIVLVNRR
jgi:drug/metabolite transporter (DMT)-like permease